VQITFAIVGKFKDIWDKDKDGSNAEKRSFIRYAIVATAFFIVLVGFVNSNNIVRWIKSGIQIQQQERQIKEYNDDISRMEDQIHGLTTSKDSLEEYARETFGFAEPGDDVYIIEDEK
jgi:cell division protein FtsB